MDKFEPITKTAPEEQPVALEVAPEIEEGVAPSEPEEAPQAAPTKTSRKLSVTKRTTKPLGGVCLELSNGKTVIHYPSKGWCAYEAGKLTAYTGSTKELDNLL